MKLCEFGHKKYGKVYSLYHIVYNLSKYASRLIFIEQFTLSLTF